MPRIKQKQNYIKENYFFFFGLFWFVIGLLMWLLVKDLFYLAYFPLGLGTMIYGHFYKEDHSAFIEWNESSITVKEWTEKSKTYKFPDVDQIIIAKEHLTIKSGAANGVMIELKDYREEDINFLRRSISLFQLKPDVS